MRRALVLSLCLSLAGFAPWVHAQDVAPSATPAPVSAPPAPPAPVAGAQPGDAAAPGYVGVVPGRAQLPTHLRGRPGATPTVVTWPGFQPRADGASRFFVQLTSRVTYEARSENGRYVVLLQGVRIPDRQTGRELDTRFFQTPVTRARLERRGRRDIAFVFEMRAEVTPTVSLDVGADGYAFLFVEFPAGDYLPRPAAPAAGQVGRVSTAPAAPAPAPFVDDERPPAVEGGRRVPE
jgi:hypothetical protein